MTRTMAIERAAALRPAVFVAFDILYDTDREIIHLPLMERKAILADVVRDNAQMSVARYVSTQGIAFTIWRKKGVWKALSAKRKDSLIFARQTDERLVKIKNLMDDELYCLR